MLYCRSTSKITNVKQHAHVAITHAPTDVREVGSLPSRRQPAVEYETGWKRPQLGQSGRHVRRAGEYERNRESGELGSSAPNTGACLCTCFPFSNMPRRNYLPTASTRSQANRREPDSTNLASLCKGRVHRRSHLRNRTQSCAVHSCRMDTARVDVEHLLAEQGRTFGRVRVAVGRTGVALGFPRDPMLHVSWWVLAAAIVAVRLLRRRLIHRAGLRLP